MSFDLKSISRNTSIKAPRLLAYGVEGIGKSTFAASAPSPIFLPTEDGLGSLAVDHFPLATSTNDVREAIASLYEGEHKFETMVIDSVDWLENIIVKEIEDKYDAKELAYGKAAIIAAGVWKEIIEGLDALRNDKGMAIILIAHSTIKRFDSPDTEPYDRHQPKLQERSSALLREWCDALLFCNYKTVIRKADVGFNKEVARGYSSGERLLFCNERPSHMAKNRYGLPDSIPMSWDAFAEAIGNNVKTG
jgi:hypothetical protein